MKYVYKIVAALGALAVIPLLLFTKLFYFKISSTALEAIMGILQMTGGNAATEEILSQTGGKIPNAIAESMSFYDIYDTAASLKDFASKGDGLGDKLEILITPAIVFVVIIALIIICAVITALFALFAKNNRKAIYTSIAGIGLSLMANSAFEAIADPILDGTVSIATLMGSVWGGLIGEIDKFLLLTNFWFVPAIFAAVIIWTVLYNYTLPDNEKRERKLMLGEADDQ